MNKRAREVLNILNRYHGTISLNEIASESPVLFHTFRNGVSELRKMGADIRWVAKEKEYQMVREPMAAIEIVENENGQRSF